MFDFAVVVFGVCTPSLLQLPSLTYSTSISDHHPSRESDKVTGVFGTPSSLSLYVFYFLPSLTAPLTDWKGAYVSVLVLFTILHLSQEIVNKEVQYNGSQSEVCKCPLNYLRNFHPLFM